PRSSLASPVLAPSYQVAAAPRSRASSVPDLPGPGLLAWLCVASGRRPHGPPAGRVTCVFGDPVAVRPPGHGGGVGLLAIGLISLTALFRYSVARRSPLTSTRSA